MPSKYEIYTKADDDSFVWVETLEDVIKAKKRLISLVSNGPGDYRLWDPARHEFIVRLDDCA
jgi:hypothetical protein